MRVQMLGLCRFSYLGGRGFQVTHDSIKDRRAFLYDAERLARRWFWFEHIALPAWLAQTDPDFTLVVMTGPDLPEPYLSRLRGLEQRLPQLKLSLLPPIEAHLDACAQAVAPHIDPTAQVVGHFRHDDDDAVSVDFIAEARRAFGLAQPLWAETRRMSCDFSRGVVLKATEAGVEAEPWLIHNASAALVIYLPPGQKRTAVHFPHWRVALSMPGIVLADKVMYARFLHHDNDSGAVGAGYRCPTAGESLPQILRDRFGIDLDLLDSAARDFGLPGAQRPRWGK